ncbi:cryptochrome/photolyase family protein, partial [Oleiagrimonas sp.]|uniref:cryptochrome/photolyase family protein n=1 Tax=Oleiagrimonas sp. TaxID=2010330 RepID=UPI00260C68C9
MTCLRLILGDQLNARHNWLREPQDEVVYVLMEVRSETDYVRHHAQKILGIFAAMRQFGEALARVGHRVEYLRIGDPRNRHSFAANLPWLIEHFGATRLERMEADEWRVEQALKDAFEASGLPHGV